jgi:hypothetical protein
LKENEAPRVVESDLIFNETNEVQRFSRSPIDLSLLNPYELALSQVTVPSVLKNFTQRRPPSESVKTLTLCNLNNIINQALAISSRCPCK